MIFQHMVSIAWTQDFPYCLNTKYFILRTTSALAK